MFGDIWRLIGFGKEINFEKYHGTFDTTLFKNILLYLSDKTYWSSNSKNPNYFSLARKLIREPLNKEHIKIQSRYAKPLYISYHSYNDDRVPFLDKDHFYKLLKSYGFNAFLHKIQEKHVDGKMIKNLNHGMGISMKLLIKKELPSLLAYLKSKNKKQSIKEIAYPCDDLIYNFKENDHKIVLTIEKLK